MQLSTQTKYTLSGIAIGLVFPLTGWILDIVHSDLAFSPAAIVRIHQDNFLHYITDLAPFVLAIVFYFLIKTSHHLRYPNFKLLLNSTGEAIYGIDLDGECTFANIRCLEMLGYQSDEELIGKNMHVLIHHTRNDGTFYPVEECKIFQAFQKGEGIHVDDEVLWRKDGSSFPSEYHSFPIQNHRKTMGAVVSFIDITTRIAAEKRSRKQLAQTNRFRNAMAEIIKLNENIEKLISPESAYKQILKIIAHAIDVERVSIWHYDDFRSSIVARSLYKRTEDAYESGLELSKKDYPNYFESLATNRIIVADDAAAHPATCEFREHYLKPLGISSMMDVPIQIQGTMIGVICHEHTGELRQWDPMEQEFAMSASMALSLVTESFQRIASEKRLRAMLWTMLDGFITIDACGTITSFNPAAERIFGYSSEEVIGNNISLLMPEPHHSRHDTYLARYKETGEGTIINTPGREVEALHKDGTTIPVAISISELTIEGKIHYRGVIRNISAQKMVEAQVIQASKLATLGEMSTSVAHELNQPLSVIGMTAGNVARKLERAEVDPEYLRGKLAKISQQVDRATAIIDHMRMFGRKASEAPSLLDPTEIVRGALSLMGEQLRLAEIHVDTDFSPRCQKVRGHPVQAEQVLLNLLTNARDALNGLPAPAEKHIRIAVQEAEDKTVKISVSDTGGGIPEKILPRIFEPFFTTKEMGHGTGLGLSVSYGIIRDMGGTIVAENVTGGARFTITLPAVEEDTA